MKQFIATGHVPTENGTKYTKQLAKHWSHNLAVEEDGDTVRITFPKNARGADWPGDAVVTMTPSKDGIGCTIAATAEGQRDGLKIAVERHIDRFAFREGALKYDWENANG